MPEGARDALIAQILPEYRAWLGKVAGGMLNPHHEALDDLIQEGYCAMWRALESFNPDASPADYWLKRSAHQRMLTVVARNHWTGQAKRSNGGHGGREPDRPVLSFEGLGEDRELPFQIEDVLASVAVEQAAWSYHEGEISAALAALTERERRYVVARFWEGMTGSEIDALLQTTASNVWKTAKPKLRESLGHLQVELASIANRT